MTIERSAPAAPARMARCASGWLFCLLIAWTALVAGAVQAAETVTYYYTSPQGTVLAKADSAGNVISTSDYRPYGSQALGAPEQGPGYTGHVNDVDSGLVYMQARYYDPEVGRMLSPDPNGVAAANVYTFNRFAYANNSPINNIDPDGRVVVVAGAPSNVRAFQGMAYRMTGIPTAVQNGVLVQSGDINGKQGYAGAATALLGAMNSHDTVTFNMVNKDPQTLGDSFALNTFDVADFSAFESKSTQFAAALLTHVLAERSFDAANGSGIKTQSGFNAAHAVALTAEASVMGAATRTESGNQTASGMQVTFNYVDPAGAIQSNYSFTIDKNQEIH